MSVEIQLDLQLEWRRQPTLVSEQQPEWVPDADAPTCSGCEEAFGLLRRRHHCRACGLVFCKPCCLFKSELPEAWGLKGRQRVCGKCAMHLMAVDMALLSSGVLLDVQVRSQALLEAKRAKSEGGVTSNVRVPRQVKQNMRSRSELRAGAPGVAVLLTAMDVDDSVRVHVSHKTVGYLGDVDLKLLDYPLPDVVGAPAPMLEAGAVEAGAVEAETSVPDASAVVLLGQRACAAMQVRLRWALLPIAVSYEGTVPTADASYFLNFPRVEFQVIEPAPFLALAGSVREMTRRIVAEVMPAVSAELAASPGSSAQDLLQLHVAPFHLGVLSMEQPQLHQLPKSCTPEVVAQMRRMSVVQCFHGTGMIRMSCGRRSCFDFMLDGLSSAPQLSANAYIPMGIFVQRVMLSSREILLRGAMVDAVETVFVVRYRFPDVAI